jgi:acetyl-CoA carboxylase biotin carboxylase subunit
VRIDTAAHAEYVVTPYYDSLIAKVIVHGRDRDEAIRRMRRALLMTIVQGVKTTIPLHLEILEDGDFLRGDVTTRFLERRQRSATLSQR